MSGIDRLRCQDREDLFAEVDVEPRLGLGVERLVADIVAAALTLAADACEEISISSSRKEVLRLL